VVFADPIFVNSVLNTFYLGFGAALLGTVFAALVAYVSVRTKYRLRGALDFLSWLPASIPGIILGLGLLWMFLRVPIFNPLYGTIGVLIMAVFFASLTTGVQLIKSNMIQLGFDLEEASTVAGGSWFYTFRNVVFPILGNVLLSVGILIFASATRNVANIAMLVTNRNRPLSMLQVDYMVEGIFEPAAIVGVITVAITCGMAMLAVAFGKRIGFRL
ncbi:MAG: ABC transporter permease subunit, partial [Alphaproteobacteria bacterium]|nr:ABC transporter permease subunit [Alphaproteobacteria bacterium]